MEGAMRIFLGVLLLVACSAPDPDLAERRLGLALAGPWQIPDATRARGDRQYVPYTGAGPWPGAGCADQVTPEAQALRAEVETRFAGVVSHVDDLACRAIYGLADRMSVHGAGRAIDIHVPTTDAGDADNDAGDPIANWLVENAAGWQVQYLIWDEWQWQGNRLPGAKDSAYGGASPHHDHLHVEVAEIEATCPVLPASGGLVDDGSACFERFGPAQYWRQESGVGEGGSFLWTNAWASDLPSNWARWTIRVAEATSHAIAVTVPPGYGGFDRVRYQVTHASGIDTVIVDQTVATGLVPLGRYGFDPGRDGSVAVFDDALGPVDPDRHIAVDAVRVDPVVTPEPVQAPEVSTEALPQAATARELRDRSSCAVGRSGSTVWIGLIVGWALAVLRRAQSSSSSSSSSASGSGHFSPV
jgi:hypothetical protein